MKRTILACLMAVVCVLTGSAQRIYDFTVKDDVGQDVPLSDYRGKVLLIVNTATRCGFTPQYTELEALYGKYHDSGLEILDFPCNQFGQQAPGTIEEIHQFCTANFDIHFPQFDKVDVNGADASPLFTFLKSQKGFGGFDVADQRGKAMDAMLRKRDADYDKKADIKWNFTKFLVGRDGTVLKRFEPTDKMSDVEAEVAKALQQPVAAEGAISNPMLWADVPDPDVIRVGDTFYMVSTTMHLMPGAPIMASKDLKNWQTVGYIFDRLTDSPKYDLTEGTVYGRGQWATSLKYHNGRFYALLAPNEAGPMGQTYIFTAEKAEGPWTVLSRMRHFHDCSLFFDDDGRVYVVYGTGELMELKADLSDVKEGTHMHIFQREADERGLLEGSRMIKHNGKYYLLMISHVWAPGRHRREVCYRADDIHGPYEKAVILESDFGGFPYVGQGTIVDTQEGDWYGIIFQDRGGVGRVLTLSPVRWIDGWPMIGDEQGKVPATMRPYKSHQPATGIVCADDFGATRLGLHWQWNHNPVGQAWSLTERPGFLRLKTSRVVPNIYLAPNTLTQRMEGPTCSGAVSLDVSKMKDGDRCGLAAFNGDSGLLTVKRQGKKYVLEMSEQSVQLTDKEKAVTKVDEKVVESVALQLPSRSAKVWLRIDADFNVGKDLANFYYSLDGEQWMPIGTRGYKMIFDYRRLFMGTKFAIFNYATKKAGGYVDVDGFDYTLR